MGDAVRLRITSRTRERAASLLQGAEEGWTFELRPPRHSDQQRALMRSMAGDLAKQVQWCGQKMSNDDWVRFCTAKLRKDRIVFDCDDKGRPDPHAGLVVLGASTREASSKMLNEMIAWFEWFGAQHNVRWSHEAAELARLQEMKR